MKRLLTVLAILMLLCIPAHALTSNQTNNGFNFFYPTEAFLGETMSVSVTDSNPDNSTTRGLSCSWMASATGSGMNLLIGKGESFTRSVSIERTADWLRFGGNQTYNTTISCASQDGRTAIIQTPLTTSFPTYNYILTNPVFWIISNPAIGLALIGLGISAYFVVFLLSLAWGPVSGLIRRVLGK